MKIFFNLDYNDVHASCINPCPFNTPDNKIHDRNPMVGSCACQECKYCYGFHESKNTVLKFIDRNDPTKLRCEPELWVKCCYPYLVHDEIPLKYQILIKLYNLKNKLLNKH